MPALVSKLVDPWRRVPRRVVSLKGGCNPFLNGAYSPFHIAPVVDILEITHPSIRSAFRREMLFASIGL